MHSKRNMSGFTLTMFFFLAAGMFLFAAVMNAEAADDPAKQIEQKLSRVKRDITTSPSRAEKGLLEAREMLTQLENADPDNAKIRPLQNNIEQLGQKLEKRLGRPVGDHSPKVKKEKAVQKQKTEPAGLPSSVTSGLQKINKDLDAVETSLTKNQLQTASNKLKNAQKKMDEIQKRFGKKIPAGNEEMKVTTDRLTAVTEKVNQAQASAG